MFKFRFRNYKKTVVVFSGIAPQNYIFEWFGSFGDLPCSIVGVKDDDNCWYQKDYLETLNTLKFNLRYVYKENLICVGGSAGGFAALLFGKSLEADKILAFCPQSACGEAKRKLGDDRWWDYCKNTPSLDIGGVYMNAIVYYAEDEILDIMHAERLVGAEIHKREFGGHDLPHKLKKNGELRNILMNLL